ncbi:histidinol dehydrogenase [Wenzhouxiangella sp. C33]|uniref:Histidinol dehydrogenase n=2 Tax=Wenzhouxiangella limi TaxID=2707351 RepID=A0A845UUT8_9GAMM|nr:histidinol dehydrogenase [Wenzhouxiangella limi]
MQIVNARELGREALAKLLARPAMESNAELRQTVADIIAEVRSRGDAALLDFGKKFDRRAPASLLAKPGELAAAAESLDPELLAAIDTAIDTVGRFHAAGKPENLSVETAPGVTCQARWQALDPVGLYVPAGSAPLPSTAIMLAVPARLAGCRQIVLATPPNAEGRADAAVLAIAHRLDIDTVLVSGGAQAVAAMAYGTESVPRVAKIFGPGNRFVTEAKRQVAESAAGAAQDLPAGPSEVLVIADDSANPDFVAMDLLSQSEHGADSQAFLVTDSADFAEAVDRSLERLTPTLARAETARIALGHGAVIVADDLDEAVAISNEYAPEHLIISTRDPHTLCDATTSAGSVFLGHYTPESLGDYISGTNHVLPTAGWARSIGGLSITDFMRRMTVQEASPDGLRKLGPPGARLAAHEGLDAHRLAITMRLDRLNQAQPENGTSA